jgi:acetyl-CoA carboxylase biotin carboxylase subunit
VDTALYQGYQVPANYDALLAKVITYAPTREIAVKKMQVAIEETVIDGVGTNLDFLYQLLNNPDFLNNKFDIEFIDRLIEEENV